MSTSTLVVLSNVALLVPAVAATLCDDASRAIAFLSAGTISAMYHMCKDRGHCIVYGKNVWMDADYVISSVIIVSMCLVPSCFDRRIMDVIAQFVAYIATALLSILLGHRVQIVAPIIGIPVAVYVIATWVWTGRTPRLYPRWLIPAVLCGAGAAFAYIMADHSTYNVYHSVWHILVALAAASFILAVDGSLRNPLHSTVQYQKVINQMGQPIRRQYGRSAFTPKYVI